MQLQQSELRALFDLIPAMVWFKDTKNNFLRANRRVTEATGKSIAEIEGKSALEIYPQEAAKYYADDLAVIEAGVPKLGIIEKVHDSAGKVLWVQTDKVPYRDIDGKIVGIVVMAQDLTERKRIETRFRRLVESNVQAVFFWNTKGEITEGNDAFLKLVGYTREDLSAGRINWAAMTPPEYADLDREAIKEVVANKVGPTYEKEWIRKDGSRVPILLGGGGF
jgi:PAS domain S-box-containing protein